MFNYWQYFWVAGMGYVHLLCFSWCCKKNKMGVLMVTHALLREQFHLVSRLFLKTKKSACYFFFCHRNKQKQP